MEGIVLKSRASYGVKAKSRLIILGQPNEQAKPVDLSQMSLR